MHRFFTNQNSIVKDTITIEGDDVQHISKVLRLREGDNITLCDQNGTDYTVRIESINKMNIKTVILEKQRTNSEAEVYTVLYQGIPKSTKMDMIIQKCTEMGIDKIVPIETDRTIVKLDSEKDGRKKVERWSKIAEEAAKQSKRGRIPEIMMPMKLSEAFKEAVKHDLSIMPYELEDNKSLREVISQSKVKSIGIIVGPEGGFESAEVEAAMRNSIIPVTLGSRILRTETAGFAVLTCIMYEYGELERNI